MWTTPATTYTGVYILLRQCCLLTTSTIWDRGTHGYVYRVCLDPLLVVLYAVEWVMWPTVEPSQPLFNSFSHRAKATRSAVGCEVTAVLLLTRYSLPSKQNQFHHWFFHQKVNQNIFLCLLDNIRPYHWGDWEPFFSWASIHLGSELLHFFVPSSALAVLDWSGWL